MFETFFRADPARNLNVSGDKYRSFYSLQNNKRTRRKDMDGSGGDKNGVTVYIRLKKYILED